MCTSNTNTTNLANAQRTMIQEMELQLHEQYAINNNSNLSSIIALLVSMLISLGAYGYVFLYSSNQWSGLGDLVKQEGNGPIFSLTALLLTMTAVSIVIFVMIYLCVYQGVAQRCEQFITDAIRRKYKMFEDGNQCVLPKGYSPYGKKCLEVVQGLYGELVKILIVVEILIVLSSLWKFYYSQNCLCDCDGQCTLVLIPVLVMLFCLCLLKEGYCKQIKKYENRQNEYKEIIEKF